METLKRVSLALVIIGAINWGLIGLFQFDLVASLFGGQEAGLSRVVYTLVGLSGLICLGMLFAPMENENRGNSMSPGSVNYGTEFGDETVISNENKDKRE
ncbi:DUF378 domain-containing protein [Virgibacillus indicus]|uniref:DUF378 domain-containing protein n=1 Tax=Virgibacillus indicus TaxID=2024554 RepID=A0A265N5N9_9BACI|nr:DUF378 domain-containing protein [Virgibacillus indicus]OZU87350.1 DUF378 domain-containing protein [Virgibacillus indicus]